jgi:hypothetical protein
MSIFTITNDASNKDIPEGVNLHEARDYYITMRNNFNSKLTPPVVTAYENKFIFRGDASAGSLKCYGSEQLIAECHEDILVYCAPRAGMAMDAIAMLAELYGKRCVFFCPASAEPSKHQKALLAYGADLRFVKIAAMPVLNSFAKRWAEQHGAKYLPFGLSNTPSVTSGIINLAGQISNQIGYDPTEIWMSISTGTAIRALQIAWPNAACRGVVVSRNMHAGEIGRASLWSSNVPFLKDAPLSKQPPFPSTANYDSKCWDDFQNFGIKDSIFINVGSDDKIDKLCDEVKNIKINSQREWGDTRDLDVGP